MIDATTFLPFALASAIVILVPGADVFLLLRVSIVHGVRAGIATLIGIHLGNCLQALLMISGVGLLVSQIPGAIQVLKIIGAAYLIYLAVTSFIAALKTPAPTQSSEESTPKPRLGPLGQGLLTNITNPKVLLFFLAFFPQFLGSTTNVAVQLICLAGIFIALALIWEGIIVLGATKLGSALNSQRFIRAMDFVCGFAFVLLAVGLLVTEL